MQRFEVDSDVERASAGASQSTIKRWARGLWQGVLGRRLAYERVQTSSASTSPPRWCPESDAGFASRLLFGWVGSLIAKGSRAQLEAEDVWDTAPGDETAALSASFETSLREHGDVGRALWRFHCRAFAHAGACKLAHDCLQLLSPLLLSGLLAGMGRRTWAREAAEAAAAGLPLPPPPTTTTPLPFLAYVPPALMVVLLFAGLCFQTLLVNAYFHQIFRLCLRLRCCLLGALHAKSLRLSPGARAEAGAGSLATLQSNDAAKLWALPQYAHMVWSAPLQIATVMALLVRVLSPLPALAGAATAVLLVPAMTLVGGVLARVRARLVAATEARTRTVHEVLTGMKTIKLHAWERAYGARIGALRREELGVAKTSARWNVLNALVFQGGPVLIALSAYSVYAGALNLPLTADVAFTALTLFGLLRFPVIMLPRQINDIVNARVALRRIRAFMRSREVAGRPAGDAELERRGLAFVADGVDLAWGSGDGPPDGMAKGEDRSDFSTPLVLSDVTLSIPKGHLVMIVGAVGSGKSTLLAALLGELAPLRGSLRSHGSLAYTQQDPWIQNASVRDNVTLAAPGAELSAEQERRYRATIEACCLEADLALLPAGDATEIGEKGVNLSGGQRHRVALARAVFADADAYLLDDPLSAVDAHVGRELASRALCGLMGASTRLLATHQLQFLPLADLVVVLEGGRVAHQGTYQDLLARGVDFGRCGGEKKGGAEDEGDRGGKEGVKDGEEGDAAKLDHGAEGAPRYALAPPPAVLGAAPGDEDSPVELLLPHAAPTEGLLPSSAHPAELTSVPLEPAPPASPAASRERRASAEAASSSGQAPDALGTGRLTGREGRAVGQVQRRIYLRYFGAYGAFFLLPAMVLSLALCERGLQTVQNWWLAAWSGATARGTESGLRDLNARYLTLYALLALASLTCQALKELTLVEGGFRAAASLHDGLLARVLRLPQSFFDGQPMGRLVNRFTRDVEAVDTTLAQVVSSFLVCAVSVAWALGTVLLVSPGVLLLVAPLLAAYAHVQRRYVRASRELKRLDAVTMSPIFSLFSETVAGLATVRAFRQQRPFAARNAALVDASNRMWWPLQCVNRWLSVRLELMGAAVVLGAGFFAAVISPRTPGLAGLAITAALQVTGFLSWMVRQTTELEMAMNSVERLVEYDDEPTEAAAIVPHNRPLPSWPAHGDVRVSNLVVRYRPDLPPVLRGISFHVQGGERVGIAGRTGCGKSTLMMALYRIVEPCGGSVVVDGLDTAELGLEDLRSRLALVPQDPVVFSGSVRSNLDPFGEAAAGEGDGQLWSVLQAVRLRDTVQALGGVDAQISEGGANLSQGQRQLLALARALVRKTRILVLDEATSNVDTATDGIVQTAISHAFRNCTVLTIAHRLHTIIDADKVLVLEAGQVAEFAAPSVLLADSTSAFAALARSASDSHASLNLQRLPAARNVRY